MSVVVLMVVLLLCGDRSLLVRVVVVHAPFRDLDRAEVSRFPDAERQQLDGHADQGAASENAGSNPLRNSPSCTTSYATSVMRPPVYWNHATQAPVMPTGPS